MPIAITMPALSPTMTEGNLAKWVKAEGDMVAIGDVVAEIETDKATMEVEAVDEGILGRIIVAEGTEAVPVNSVIALLMEEGEDASALEGYDAPVAAPPARAPVEAALPVAPPEAATVEAAAIQAAPVTPAPVTLATAPRVPGGDAVAPEGNRINASPLARRMAQQAGLDLSVLAGSGPHGRIVKRDIDAALAGQGEPGGAAAPAARPTLAAAETEIPHTAMRKTIARRLVESTQSIPHIYLTIDCEIDALLELRTTLNQRAEAAAEGYKLTVNDFVVRASALALRKVPRVNASWSDAAILEHTAVDVAVAVALDDGLITPIIRNADHKGLAAISVETKELAARARAGKLMPEEYQGGGFSVSNLGMFGIRDFTAVINPPHAAILAVGAGEQRAVVKDGALAIATVMSCTISADHRVIDGAVAARFLAALKRLIDDPLSMLL